MVDILEKYWNPASTTSKTIVHGTKSFSKNSNKNSKDSNSKKNLKLKGKGKLKIRIPGTKILKN